MLGGVVRGKAVTLRTPREEDLAAVNAWMADMRVRRRGHLWDEPGTLATWKQRLTEVAKDPETVLWTVESGGRAVGTVRFGLYDTGAWVQHFVLDPAVWGQGYGGDAALAVHRYLFDYLDKRRCSVEMVADNAAGLRIAARLGYREFGRGHEVYYRDGAYADDVWLRLVRETWNEHWPGEREYPPFPEGIER